VTQHMPLDFYTNGMRLRERLDLVTVALQAPICCHAYRHGDVVYAVGSADIWGAAICGNHAAAAV